MGNGLNHFKFSALWILKTQYMWVTKYMLTISGLSIPIWADLTLTSLLIKTKYANNFHMKPLAFCFFYPSIFIFDMDEFYITIILESLEILVMICWADKDFPFIMFILWIKLWHSKRWIEVNRFGKSGSWYQQDDCLLCTKILTKKSLWKIAADSTPFEWQAPNLFLACF